MSLLKGFQSYTWERDILNPNIESLNLDLFSCDLEILGSSLVQTHYLHNLSVNINDMVDNVSASHLENGISKNRSLKSINLKFSTALPGAIRSILLSCLRNPCLTSLDLSHCSFPTEATIDSSHFINGLTYSSELGAFTGNPLNLKQLNLSHCRLMDSDISILASTISVNSCNLEVLDLSGNTISTQAAIEISIALKTNQKLEKINLSNCKLNDDGAYHIGSSLTQNQNIHDLNLSVNQIGPIGAQQLAIGISQNSTISKLSLSHNPLKSQGLSYIFNALATSTSLKDLDISFTSFDQQAWNLLAELLNTWPTIKSLNLAGNMVNHQKKSNEESLDTITKVETTNIASEKLLDLIIADIASSLTPSTMEQLQKDQNNSDSSMDSLSIDSNDNKFEYFCKSLQTNANLTCIDLSRCFCGDTGAQIIANVLEVNNTIVDLKLKRCGITSEGVMLIADKLKNNTSLCFIDLTGNEADTLGHIEPVLFRNRLSRSLAWRKEKSHCVVVQRPHAEFTYVCAVTSQNEAWISCTDGHIHFWPLLLEEKLEANLEFIEVHQPNVRATRKRINCMVPCKSTVWVLTDEPQIIVVSQSKPRKISYLPQSYQDSERLCMCIVDHQNHLAVVGGGYGDISLWNTQPGNENMLTSKVLSANFPIVSVACTSKFILAGLVIPGRHSSMIVVLDLSLEELYRQEVGLEALRSILCVDNYVITTFANQNIKLWNFDSREMCLISVDTYVGAQIVHRCGEQLLSASSKSSSLVVWTPKNLQQISSIATSAPVKSFCVGSTYMITLTEDESVSFWTRADDPGSLS